MTKLRQPVRTDTLAAQVVGILKDAIFEGKLQPGEPLREMHLARSLDVSQATIREALAQLEQMGLVVRAPNRRTTVTNFTRDEVAERLTIRLALEEIAWAKAAPRLTDADYARLEELASTIDSALEGNNYREATMADLQFHHHVWDCANSPVLRRTLDQLTTPLFAFLSAFNQSNMVDLHATRSHAALLTALRTRDEQRVREAIRRHIENSFERFLSSIPVSAPTPDVSSDQIDEVIAS
jgi:DNA-binding GntR family transcriptional regulator